MALTQSTDYVANDPFPAATHEDALDRLTFISQQIQEEVNRSIKLSRTNTMTSTEFTTSAADRANKILAFDTSGELAVTQELGTYKGTDTTTTTAAYTVRDIIKSTTAGQLNNVYICIAISVIGDTLTDTDHFELLVDAYSAASSAAAAASSATDAQTAQTAAELAETNAETAETNAETAETNAAASEANAAASEANAATSESNAATSESNASTSESNASTSASTATTQAGIATTQAGNASTSASNAATSESNAATSESNAATSESNAATSESNAATSESNASTSETNAAASAAAAAASADTFDDTYLGSKSSDPSVDNDGDALNAGDLYFNTTSNTLKVYTGSAWQDAAIDSSGFVQTTGDTMTGALVLNSNLSANGGAVFNEGGADVDFRIETNGNANMLFVDGGNNRVGIGTSSPAAPLHLYETTSNTTTTSEVLRIQSTSSGTTGVGFGGTIFFIGQRADGNMQGMAKISAVADVNAGTTLSSALTFETATAGTNAERMRIDSSGNVGIGVVPNSSWHSTLTALQLGGNASLSAQSAVGASKQAYFSQNVFNDGDQKYISTDQASNYLQQNGTHVFQVAASGSANAVISWNTAMTVDNSGNVGIGTSSPNSKTHIVGAANAIALRVTNGAVDGNNADLVHIEPSNGAYVGKHLRIQSGRSDFSDSLLFLNTTAGINGTNGSYIRMQDQADADIFRIKGDGNVGIGTGSPRAKVDINGGLHLAGGTQIQITGNSGTTGLQLIGQDADVSIVGTMSAQALVFRTGSTERMRIDATGAVTMPLQPAFMVHPSTAQLNIPTNTFTNVVFGTERFDNNSDFASNTFTAPVTGKYQLQVNMRLDSLDKDNNNIQAHIITSNKSYYSIIQTAVFASDPAFWWLGVTVLADMDASDTAYVRLYISNDGAAQMDVQTDSYFSGYLVA
jgi:hypothetical protein